MKTFSIHRIFFISKNSPLTSLSSRKSSLSQASWVISDFDSVAPPPLLLEMTDREIPKGEIGAEQSSPGERENRRQNLYLSSLARSIALGRKTEDGCPSTLRQV